MNESTAQHAQPGDKKPVNPKWKWAKRILTLFFFIMVPALLFMLVKNLDWQDVKKALQSYEASTLLLAVGICAASYAAYSCFDVLGRYYTKHKLPATQIVPVVFVCYAFNLNLSAWVGGIALRYRLYSRLGLDVPTITKVFTFSMITNWLGYMLLAGVVFSSRLLDLPESWSIGATSLQIIGFVLLLVAGGYLLACAFSKRRIWHIRNQTLTLPSVRLALIQAGLGALNWSLMALLIHTLLPDEAFYPAVLGVLLISSIAGVVTHIPAGLGVLEAVFIALLQHQMSKSDLLAALIGYRAIYFLLPLAIACVVYLVLEKRAKKLRNESGANQGPEQSTSVA
ncbi:lysylphosphatidylglycerol synthase domain-containing protein [Pseudomonas borbori]